MAKRAKKSGQTKPKKPLSKPRGNRKAGGKKRPGSPRSQVLPGHEKVRDQKLDTYCEDIGEGLALVNRGAKLVNDSKILARDRMRDKKLLNYHNAGVTIRFKEGVDRVSVKLTKETQDSGGEPKGPSDTALPPAGGLADSPLTDD